jgi:perosamine synthetase
MLDRGIQVSNYFPPVHLQPFIAEQYGCKEGDMPVTDEVVKGTIALPFHNHLTGRDIELVCTELRACLDEI